jgi:uncharacterized protein YdhG (YjbR/CyaY superfamily)
MDAMPKVKFKTVDEYLSYFPAAIQTRLQALRKTIKKAAPEAEELISYNMPAFKQGRILVYFAAFKNHIGLYPTVSPMIAFKKELSVYESGKGSIQFPHDQPIPLDLVTKIVQFKKKENMEKMNGTVRKKK